MDPFRVVGPATVSFSGGLTSAYMLRRVLDAYDGALPGDVHVLFADTGKEREETYAFVREVGERWGVEIVRVARPGLFDQLIVDRSYLPNPVTRFCTQELKIRPMKNWMRARGYEHWTNAVGIRADEPRRVAKIRGADRRERFDVALPLATAGVTLADVRVFWDAQSFTLNLRPWEGNCDLCFLKGAAKRRRIMEERPDLAGWWIEQERRTGARFRADSQSYAALLASVQKQVRLPLVDDDSDAIADCFCGEGVAGQGAA